MSNRLKFTQEEEARISYLSTLLAGLPQDSDPDFETLSAFEQDFLASVRRQFDIWSELSIGQEETLEKLWLKYQERKPPHDD